MTTKDRVKELAARRKITIAELERTLGIANGTIGKWDKQNPSIEPLTKIASFFGVSTDYLLGLDNTVTALDDDIVQFFKMETAGLTDEEKETLTKEWKDYLVIRKKMLRGE